MTEVFRQHTRELLDHRYVYAVVSRRSRGLSIGVNLNPDKACNFACPYCQVDRTAPGGPRDVDTGRLHDELVTTLRLAHSGEIWSQPRFQATPEPLRVLRDIAIAGDGEPTACPQLLQALGAIERARALSAAPTVPVVMLTNATLVHRARVRFALRRFDAMGGTLWVKLDAGTEDVYKFVDGSAVPFGRVLRNLQKSSVLRPVVVQSLFFQAPEHPALVAGPDDVEVDAWVARLVELTQGGGAVREVQVTTIARPTAQAGLIPVPATRLEQIAQRARAAGLNAVAYP